MRRRGGHHICEPAPIPGEVAAARARERIARRARYRDVTGSIRASRRARRLEPYGDDSPPLAIPGVD
jgi:hypothetical protein